MSDWKSISSSLRIEPFAALFWALGIVLVHIQQGSVRFNLIAEASPSPFSSLDVLYCTYSMGWGDQRFY